MNVVGQPLRSAGSGSRNAPASSVEVMQACLHALRSERRGRATFEFQDVVRERSQSDGGEGSSSRRREGRRVSNFWLLEDPPVPSHAVRKLAMPSAHVHNNH